jgi:hypothetical protein
MKRADDFELKLMGIRSMAEQPVEYVFRGERIIMRDVTSKKDLIDAPRKWWNDNTAKDILIKAGVKYNDDNVI